MEAVAEMPSHLPSRWKMTWEEVHNALNMLHARIEAKKFKPTTIVAIAKGGIIPAGLLLQRYPEAHFIVLRASAYNKDNQPKKVTIHNPEVLTFVNPETTLVVDEICDSGNTFATLDKSFPEMMYASMLRRDGCTFKQYANFMGWFVPKGVWVDFPWEY